MIRFSIWVLLVFFFPLCLRVESTDDDDGKHTMTDFLMYSGYLILGLLLVILVIFRLCKRKRRGERVDAVNDLATIDEGNSTVLSINYKTSQSADSIVSSSLIVLTSPVVNGLKFEDLLKAPAELLGRGIHGSVYKVMFENGSTLVVKRIKDWRISNDSFMKRMRKINRLKHPNVLPPIAFYSSKQEKLLVYDYQPNGSLFRLLHGIRNEREFNWRSRVSVAERIAKALAFMHEELEEDGISHGNFKSSNILIDRNMEPCISEYGLMEMETEENDSHPSKLSRDKAYRSFKADVYGFGAILLELLTRKLVHNNGVDLTEWVRAILEEEWTTEVFDKSLISGGEDEERMVNLLQVAIKCVDHVAENRPSMKEVANMIEKIMEEDETSLFDEKSLLSSAEISQQDADKLGK